MASTVHGPHCPRPYKGDCLKFGTDLTRTGVDIAHTFGTTSEDRILEIARSEDWEERQKNLTGMAAEQKDWEGNFDDDTDDVDQEEDD